MVCRSGPSRPYYSVNPRELALCGVLGALALILPAISHVLHFWRLFMPMHLPIMTLAFLVRPAPAAVTAGIVPLISAALTGMPPFYPPVAVFMCMELATMSYLTSVLYRAWSWARNALVGRALILAGVMIVGRLVYVGLVYGFSLLVSLPANLLAGISFLVGWPGMILMLIVIPPVITAAERHPKPVID